MVDQGRRDDPMDRLLRAALAREGDAAAGACPDAEQMAVYLERRLSSREVAAFEAHAAVCARCQDALAVVATTLPHGEGTQGAPVSAEDAEGGWRWWPWRWLVPASAAVALGVAVFVAVGPRETTNWQMAGRPAQVEEARGDIELTAPAPGGAGAAAVPPVAAAREEPAGREAAARDEAAAPREAVRPRAADSGIPARGEALQMRRESAEVPAEDLVAADRAAPFAPVPAEVSSASPAAAPQAAQKQAGAPAAAPTPEAEARVAAPAMPATPPSPMADAGVAGGVAAPAAGRSSRATPAAAEAFRVEGAALPAAGPVRWRVAPSGTLERTADDGRSWAAVDGAIPARLFAAATVSARVAWAVGADGLVLVTTDGARWEARRPPDRVDLVALQATSALHAIVTAGDGRRFQTSDGGLTWVMLGR